MMVPRADGPQLAACQNHLWPLDLFQLPQAGPGHVGLVGPPPGPPPQQGVLVGLAERLSRGWTEVWDLAFQEQICN